jgi:polar amino acid transport system ATP-binding protein
MTGIREAKPVLNARSLRKSFGAHEVLRGIDLEVHAGEVLAVIGSSGSGKSTLLRCMNLLETPSSGTLSFEGHSFSFPSRQNRKLLERGLRSLRSQVGMVFQSYNLWPHMTVLDNIIEAPMKVLKMRRDESVDVAHGLLQRIGLADKARSYPRTLSGGQQQRVAIVRCLAMQPKLMLFDEVTSALDPELVGEVLSLMSDLAAQGMTMITVTHEMSFARSVSTRTIFIDNGEIAEQGASKEFLFEPRTPRARSFLTRFLDRPAT